ncbi:MAG: transcriptional repressor [Fimbriimonadaceae bacterium]|nr:transcriptional repressor [Fimbriimonadaceae bacterium]
MRQKKANLARESAAIETMRSHGLRVTSPRLLVLRTLFCSKQPLNAQQIHQGVRDAGGHLDVVTVYRILAAFQEIGLVHFIGVSGGYSACSLGECHEEDSEHAVCETCGRVIELEVPELIRQSVSVPLEGVGFSARSVRIEILGQCQSCLTA